MRKDAADPAARLAVLPELERTLQHFEAGRSGHRFEFGTSPPGSNRWPLSSARRGLVVEGVHRAGAAVHEQLHHAFHFGPVVQAAVQDRAAGVGGRVGFGQQPISASICNKAERCRSRPPERHNSSRREIGSARSDRSRCRFSGVSLRSWLIHKHEFVGVEHHATGVGQPMLAGIVLPPTAFVGRRVAQQRGLEQQPRSARAARRGLRRAARRCARFAGR